MVDGVIASAIDNNNNQCVELGLYNNAFFTLCNKFFIHSKKHVALHYVTLHVPIRIK